MNFKEREILIEAFFDEVMQELHVKGADYSTNEDALSNFKRNAEKLELSKYQIWNVYFSKHLDAIDGAIKRNPEDPQVKSEPLNGRIKDSIAYLALLYCLLNEDKRIDEEGSVVTYTDMREC